MQTADVTWVLRRIGKSWVSTQQQTLGQIDHSLARAPSSRPQCEAIRCCLARISAAKPVSVKSRRKVAMNSSLLLQGQDFLNADEIGVAITVDVVIHDGLCAGDRPADGR